MAIGLEILMILAFCAGTAVLAVEFTMRGHRISMGERLQVIGMGCGFIAGLISAVQRGTLSLIILYGIGIVISCAAIILSNRTGK